MEAKANEFAAKLETVPETPPYLLRIRAASSVARVELHTYNELQKVGFEPRAKAKTSQGRKSRNARHFVAGVEASSG